jgi:acyl-CoA synthetase (AMP-forming)/AMP-acid ligase II
VTHFVEELLAVARSAPDVVALRWFGGRDGVRVREEVSFGDLAERVERTAAGLRAQGLEPGDRVLFSIRPRPEGVILCLAVLRAGGAVVFVDPGSTPELFAARIAAARPRWAATEALLYAASSGPLRGVARSRGLLLPNYGRLPVRHLYTGAWLPGVPRGARRVVGLGRAVPGSRVSPGSPSAPEGADREALVVFTSGTTSDPKAVVHTARTLGGMLDLFAQVGDLKPRQRAHTDQMFLGLPAIIAGGTWEIPAKAPKDAPEAFARGVAGADSSFLVPADVTALLDVLETRGGGAPAADGAGPAVLAVGAAPVTVAP